MLLQKKEIIESHIKTHTERSADDVAAVSTVEYFLRTGGRIITNFSKNDKWPNIDGTFEFVSNPEFDRRPRHNFFVQIKGTNNYSESDSAIKYSLKSLAFPAFIASVKHWILVSFLLFLTQTIGVKKDCFLSICLWSLLIV